MTAIQERFWAESVTDLIERILEVIVAAMKAAKISGRRAAKRVEMGQYVVADPEVCHGQPTFKGTRIMVSQVLDDVADGRSWEFICNKRWGGRIPLAAVAEAVRLARAAWLDTGQEMRHGPKFRSLAAA